MRRQLRLAQVIGLAGLGLCLTGAGELNAKGQIVMDSDNKEVITNCGAQNDWFRLTLRRDPLLEGDPEVYLNFSFIEDGDAFKVLGGGSKFATESENVEKITVTPNKIRIHVARAATSNSPYTFFRVGKECRLGFLAYVKERPDLAKKLVIQDHDG